MTVLLYAQAMTPQTQIHCYQVARGLVRYLPELHILSTNVIISPSVALMIHVLSFSTVEPSLIISSSVNTVQRVVPFVISIIRAVV
jgi:hypothetical protein